MIEKQQTANNNDFQNTISEYLKKTVRSTNNLLEIQRYEDGTIIIKPAGNSTIHEKKTRNIYCLFNEYDDNRYLSLTHEQSKLLEWLYLEDILNEDWKYMTVDDFEVEEI